MTDEAPTPDDEQDLFVALCEGDATRAGKLLMKRQVLARDEIELIAELLLGNKAAMKYCSHRLAFERWGRGRPTDPLENRARSQDRARAIEREVQKGVKVEAVLEDISRQTRTAISTLKKDRRSTSGISRRNRRICSTWNLRDAARHA